MTPIQDKQNETEKKLREWREYKVVKSNDLIQKSRFQLSLQEQRIVLYLISKIKPDQKEFESYRFNITQFCQVCGIDEDNGKNYINIKASIQAIADHSVWLMMPNGKETLLRIIEKAYIDPNTGIIEIRIDNDMKPHLLHLKECFTQYELLYTLAMRSQYSVHIYELLKSLEYKHTDIVFDIEELKKKMMATHYKRFPDFRRKVLDIAVREINDVSDINISYQINKDGRKFTRIEFCIKRKEDLEERMVTWAKISRALDSKDTDKRG